jgi:hypothetical protein
MRPTRNLGVLRIAAAFSRSQRILRSAGHLFWYPRQAGRLKAVASYRTPKEGARANALDALPPEEGQWQQRGVVL